MTGTGTDTDNGGRGEDDKQLIKTGMTGCVLRSALDTEREGEGNRGGGVDKEGVVDK